MATRAMDESVAEWFATTSNPMAPVMRAVRDVIVTEPDITETIKYRAPAFEYDSIICYFNWSAKKRVSLIFPTGQKHLADHDALVDGSNLQRMMYFDDLDDVAAKRDDLLDVLSHYLAHHD